MNLLWINNINEKIAAERKSLQEYNTKRTRPLLDAIECARLIKEQAIINAKLAMLNAFQNYEYRR